VSIAVRPTGAVLDRPTHGSPARLLRRLRTEVSQLARIHRPSASPGELEAAEQISATLQAAGVQARIEHHQVHGSYHRPLGLLMMAGLIAGVLGRGGRVARGGATALGAAAAASVWDDVTGGKHWFRGLLRQRTTHNVIAEIGPADAEHSLILIAHHDAAPSGQIFNPSIPRTLHRLFPKLAELKSSPPIMFPVFAGPVLAAVGALSGKRSLATAGAVVSGGAIACFADIGHAKIVPGANDNVSGVVCLQELARRLTANPLDSLRVLLVSTGSEESFMEGMRKFAQQHFGSLPLDKTFVLCVDTVGSQHLCQLRAEGMLRLYRYPGQATQLLSAIATEHGIEVENDVVLRNATDGLHAVKAGYPTAMLGSISDFRAPANYHWHTDTAENVNYDTLADAVSLCEGLARRLDRCWPFTGWNARDRRPV
jgi:hypothetical protein